MHTVDSYRITAHTEASQQTNTTQQYDKEFELICEVHFYFALSNSIRMYTIPKTQLNTFQKQSLSSTAFYILYNICRVHITKSCVKLACSSNSKRMHFVSEKENHIF